MNRYKWFTFVCLGFITFVLLYLNFDMNGYKGRRELNQQLNALIRDAIIRGWNESRTKTTLMNF